MGKILDFLAVERIIERVDPTPRLYVYLLKGPMTTFYIVYRMVILVAPPRNIKTAATRFYMSCLSGSQANLKMF